MGCTFEFAKKRWKNIELGEEITNLIKEMKNEKEIKNRPSIEKSLKRLILYCDEKKYSDSIDIIPFLKENKNFIQTPFNEDLPSLKILIQKK